MGLKAHTLLLCHCLSLHLSPSFSFKHPHHLVCVCRGEVTQAVSAAYRGQLKAHTSLSSCLSFSQKCVISLTENVCCIKTTHGRVEYRWSIQPTIPYSPSKPWIVPPKQPCRWSILQHDYCVLKSMQTEGITNMHSFCSSKTWSKQVFGFCALQYKMYSTNIVQYFQTTKAKFIKTGCGYSGQEIVLEIFFFWGNAWLKNILKK